MDNLHEELNVRQRKPYIENPDFRRDIRTVADEFWANFLRRNWSVMVFLFYGQSKYLIRCGHCNRDKVSYQPFSSLSVPLPNANTLLLPVVVH